MKELKADEILKADDLQIESVDVPEWGGCVFVKTMTGAERDDFDGTLVVMGPGGARTTNLKNYRARLVVATATDKDGKLLFNPSHIERLGKKSAAALDRIFEVAARLNAIGPEEMKAIEKN